MTEPTLEQLLEEAEEMEEKAKQLIEDLKAPKPVEG